MNARNKPGTKAITSELMSSLESMKRTGTQFLKIDLETALTFVKNARGAKDQVRRQRNIGFARKAYETVTELSQKMDLRPADADAINRTLQKLKGELAQLGEIF